MRVYNCPVIDTLLVAQKVTKDYDGWCCLRTTMVDRVWECSHCRTTNGLEACACRMCGERTPIVNMLPSKQRSRSDPPCPINRKKQSGKILDTSPGPRRVPPSSNIGGKAVLGTIPLQRSRVVSSELPSEVQHPRVRASVKTQSRKIDSTPRLTTQNIKPTDSASDWKADYTKVLPTAVPQKHVCYVAESRPDYPGRSLSTESTDVNQNVSPVNSVPDINTGSKKESVVFCLTPTAASLTSTVDKIYERERDVREGIDISQSFIDDIYNAARKSDWHQNPSYMNVNTKKGPAGGKRLFLPDHDVAILNSRKPKQCSWKVVREELKPQLLPPPGEGMLVRKVGELLELQKSQVNVMNNMVERIPLKRDVMSVERGEGSNNMKFSLSPPSTVYSLAASKHATFVSPTPPPQLVSNTCDVETYDSDEDIIVISEPSPPIPLYPLREFSPTSEGPSPRSSELERLWSLKGLKVYSKPSPQSLCR